MSGRKNSPVRAELARAGVVFTALGGLAVGPALLVGVDRSTVGRLAWWALFSTALVARLRWSEWSES